MRRFLLALPLLATFASLSAGACHATVSLGSPSADAPALDAIRTEEMRSDLAYLASDAMRGREGGTVDEARASAWIAERARAAGLEPAGDDGTFFQFWPMRRTRVAPGASVAIGGAAVPLARETATGEAVLLAPVDARVDAPIVWVGEGRERDLAGQDVRGKVVAAVLTPPDNPVGGGRWQLGREISARRYTMLAARQRAAFLTTRGASAVILVSDSVADTEFDNVSVGWAHGEYTSAGVMPATPAAATRPPVLWVRRGWLDRVRAPGARLAATVTAESFVVQSVNVVARTRGRSEARRAEYLLYSGHTDGLGVRWPWAMSAGQAGDSIWRGADDNASMCVAMLAIARAFVRAPAERSVLFVWHGSEELGLLGSGWFATHPTVPKSSIVGVINADMIGRNAPDSAALLGSQPPNRTSSTMIAAALRANERVGHFAIDSSGDRPTDAEGLFRRSDHWPYVRQGLPAIYFTTMLDPDYHTPHDSPGRIDYAKLTRMARWMYETGWTIANAAERPAFEGASR